MKTGSSAREACVSLSALLGATGEGVLRIDSRGKVAECNAAAARLIGCPRDEIRGRRFFGEVVAVRPGETETGELTAARQQAKQPDSTPIRRGAAGGNQVWRVHYLPLSPPSADGFVVLLAPSESLIPDPAKKEFVANISHELRTPMNAILGMLDLVRRSPQLTGPLRDYLATAHDAATLMLALVNDLLDFSRLDVGKLELISAPFSLRDTLGEAMRVLALRARDRQLDLACHVHGDVPDALVGDSRRLRQVVMNLVGNAIKFTPEGEVVLTAAVEEIGKGRARLRLSVRDTGIGIAPELRERIFEPFTQVDDSDTRTYAGSGLGLTISKKIVELLGGRIWCESGEDVGTTFHCQVDFAVRKVAQGLPSEVAEHLRGRTVLIVEPHASTRQVLLDLVTDWGMSPLVIAEPRQEISDVLATTGRNSCDLLLVGADARDSQGRAYSSDLNNLRQFGSVILIVPPGELEAGGGASWIQAGASAVIEKPVLQSDLLQAIARASGDAGAVGTATWIAPIESTPRSLSLLVAEDIVANQKVVQSILELRGHRVEIVGHGQDAVERARQRRYDAILMDVRMPVLSGIEATEAIRRLKDPQLANVPIVALTAHVASKERQRCLHAGMSDFVTKPIIADELIRAVEMAAGSGDQKRRAVQMGSRSRSGGRRELRLAGEGVSRSSAEELNVPKGASAPVVNLERALARLGDNQELLRELADYFVVDVPELSRNLRQALKEEQFEEATRAAHSIKGLAAGFDAAALVETAGRIEDLTRAQRKVAAREMLDRLDLQIQSVIEKLQAELLQDSAKGETLDADRKTSNGGPS